MRDIANAYALAVTGSASLARDVIFNVASGVPRRIGDILTWLLHQSKVPIAVERDRNRVRPNDLPRIIGDASRIREALEWEPEHNLEETLAEILDDCRHRVSLAENAQSE